MALELNWTVKIDHSGIPHPSAGPNVEHAGEIALSGPVNSSVEHKWRVESQNANSPEGRGIVQPFQLSKEMDQSTPSLLLACLGAWHIPNVVITGWATVPDGSTNKHEPVMRIELKGCGITNAEHESFTVCFEQVTWTYRDFTTEGKDSLKKSTHWSVLSGKGA